MKTTYIYYFYHHMDRRFRKIIHEIESAIKLKDWEKFCALYDVWHTGNDEFEYLPDVIVQMIESDGSLDFKNITLNKETFMLIDDCDWECG